MDNIYKNATLIIKDFNNNYEINIIETNSSINYLINCRECKKYDNVDITITNNFLIFNTIDILTKEIILQGSKETLNNEELNYLSIKRYIPMMSSYVNINGVIEQKIKKQIYIPLSKCIINIINNIEENFTKN